jgi:hypothetical protein
MTLIGFGLVAVVMWFESVGRGGEVVAGGLSGIALALVGCYEIKEQWRGWEIRNNPVLRTEKQERDRQQWVRIGKAHLTPTEEDKLRQEALSLLMPIQASVDEATFYRLFKMTFDDLIAQRYRGLWQ